MSALTLYPPAPAGVPEDLTRPSSTYRVRVVVLMVSLALFLLVYLALLVGTAYLTYWAATRPFGDRGQWNPFLNGAATVFFGLLFLFLLKGLFKGRRADRSYYVELQRDDQPDLFAFIDRLCDEVGAPRPAKVYVSPDVNAAVIYDTSLLNLFIPPKKHLLIGLGLVNCVNLSEFKATLAHEFGHFSQGSLALGRYVYVVNQILRDIVYGRDKWDDFINGWCRIDIRLSFPAWALKGVVWVLRGVLDKIFRAITLMDLALSRQMEFNADDVAVSVAGSDAIVNVLCRLDFAGEALNVAARDLHTAADHELFTADLFYHQTAAATWLRQLRKDPKLGLPPDPPADPATPVQVFDPAKGDGTPEMWRTHPANHDRERNAKRHYLHVPIDDRSPWLIFHDLDRLKRDVTERFYTLGLQRREPYQPADPAAVQKFIDDEHAETTYDPKYQGLYDDRFLSPGDLPAVVPQVEDEDWPEARVTEFLRDWPGADLETRMKEHLQRRNDMQMISGLKSGEYTLKKKTFTMRDQEYTMRDVEMLYQTLEKELADDRAAFDELDKKCFKAHFTAARLMATRGAAPPEWAAELLKRYQFHVETQELLRTLINDDYRMNATLRYYSGRSELQQDEFQGFLQLLRDTSNSLADCVAKADKLSTPALTNVPEGTMLRRLIWEKDADLPHLDGNPKQIRFDWIADYLRKQNAAQDRIRRIHFKSLGNILVLQEKIARAWRDALPPEPAPPPEVPAEMLNLP